MNNNFIKIQIMSEYELICKFQNSELTLEEVYEEAIRELSYTEHEAMKLVSFIIISMDEYSRKLNPEEVYRNEKYYIYYQLSKTSKVLAEKFKNLHKSSSTFNRK